MRGEARLTEANTQEMLREIRIALLEADVALPVVRDFIAKVREKALGQEVLASLSPGQALVGVVHDELTALIGGTTAELNFATQPPAIILMAGLQGAGKTTTVGKLAKWLREQKKKKVLTVSCDVYRPAAIDQLKTVTAQAGADFFASTPDQKPLDIAQAAVLWAQSLSRRGAGRHRRTPGYRRGHDGRDRRAAWRAQADRDALRGRCDAGPGRGQYRARL